MTDRATQVLDGLQSGSAITSLQHAAETSGVPRTTLQHRARGRRSLLEKAQSQQYLRSSQEIASVRFLLQQDALGHKLDLRLLRHILTSEMNPSRTGARRR
ncbi:uncharacterized protein K489DRAFT_370251 [Dissoconium aciculare CBS 342.82]|uniref:HTH psq-type domain-containing protein n=1 Tax=Dissoconium aciculare CBS 342.82 TaxID=1314786 RepID=A0A6J3M520_9PEZI|nr:uncharacterized protein K489DRAFT_370251 [Dissoconium aciculare CBS 342.82]KAF1822599.1 hypothetical protein K489DRAFT_370251 [Dissoconium aciculare CBS 342.82]